MCPHGLQQGKPENPKLNINQTEESIKLDSDTLGKMWLEEPTPICGNYKEHKKLLGKPDDWLGCSLLPDHEGKCQ